MSGDDSVGTAEGAEDSAWNSVLLLAPETPPKLPAEPAAESGDGASRKRKLFNPLVASKDISQTDFKVSIATEPVNQPQTQPQKQLGPVTLTAPGAIAAHFAFQDQTAQQMARPQPPTINYPLLHPQHSFNFMPPMPYLPYNYPPAAAMGMQSFLSQSLQQQRVAPQDPSISPSQQSPQSFPQYPPPIPPFGFPPSFPSHLMHLYPPNMALSPMNGSMYNYNVVYNGANAGKDFAGSPQIPFQSARSDPQTAMVEKLHSHFPRVPKEFVKEVLITSGWNPTVAKARVKEYIRVNGLPPMDEEDDDDTPEPKPDRFDSDYTPPGSGSNTPAKKKRKLVKKSLKVERTKESLIRRPDRGPASRSNVARYGSKFYGAEETYGGGADSDEYGSDGSGGGGELPKYETNPRVAKRVLSFFNESDLTELVENLLLEREQAEPIVANRPYRSINHLKDSFNLIKKSYLKLIDRYADMLDGYDQVDRICEKCEMAGEEIMDIMRVWTGNKVDGENCEELDITKIQDGGGDEDYLKAQPAFVNSDLKMKEYQITGVNWLYVLYKQGLGAILADEMGLGKTCQVIVFLGLLKSKNAEGPHIVIVPSSTIENWLREFQQWCPELEVSSYYGSQTDRHYLREELEKKVPDVIVTTYNTASTKEDKIFLKSYGFKCMILDEGHMVKNRNSVRFKNLDSIRSHFRVILTGTPLQNNLLELLSLLTFILPPLFQNETKSLQRIFSIKALGGSFSSSSSATALLSRARVTRARRMLVPFILRRKKADVLSDLPQKIVEIVDVEMTPTQARLYASVVADCKKAMKEGMDKDAAKKAGVDKKSVDEAKATQDGPVPMQGKDRVNVLMQLRKVANHPLLFRKNYTLEKIHKMAKDIMKEPEFSSSVYEYVVQDFEYMSDFDIHCFCEKHSDRMGKYMLDESKWMDAGKVIKLKEMLPRMIENGDRVLIFSQFVIMLNILESVMETLKIEFLRLDGQTAVTERQDLIDHFNSSNVPVFLLTTKAGGLGLNLTTANTVILFDMDFNPHNDIQAEDRAHRVGQTRDVRVYKFITAHTVETHIHRLASTKLNLDKRLQNDDVADEEDEDDGKKKGKGKKAAKELESEPVVNEEEKEGLLQALKDEWFGEGAVEGDVAAPEDPVKSEEDEDGSADNVEDESMAEADSPDESEVAKAEEVKPVKFKLRLSSSSANPSPKEPAVDEPLPAAVIKAPTKFKIKLGAAPKEEQPPPPEATRSESTQPRIKLRLPRPPVQKVLEQVESNTEFAVSVKNGDELDPAAKAVKDSIEIGPEVVDSSSIVSEIVPPENGVLEHASDPSLAVEGMEIVTNPPTDSLDDDKTMVLAAGSAEVLESTCREKSEATPFLTSDDMDVVVKSH